jgi:hypothetical protein
VSVPGQLVALAHDTLYTREIAHDQGALGMRIHR